MIRTTQNSSEDYILVRFERRGIILIIGETRFDRWQQRFGRDEQHSLAICVMLKLESIFQVIMSRKVISGIIQLGPMGPNEWFVFFVPALDGPIETIPRGLVSEKNTEQVEICLRALGFAETKIAVISNFDCDKDELRAIKFDLVDGQFSLVRRLGLVSDNMGPFTPEENRRLGIPPPI